MKKLALILLVMFVTIVACGKEEPDTEMPPEMDTEQPNSDEETGDDPTEVEEDSEYTAVKYDALVPVVQYVFDDTGEMMFLAMEKSAEELERETALKMSLTRSDQTTTSAFQGLDSVEMNEGVATLNFTGNPPFVSLASAEQMVLDQMLYQMGTLYDIKTFIFTLGGERGVDYGQVGFVEELTVESLDVTGVVEVTNERLIEPFTQPVFRPIREMVPLQLETFEQTLTKTATFKAPEGFRAVFSTDEIIKVEESRKTVTVTVTGDRDENTTMIEALALMAMQFDFDTLVITDETSMTKTMVTLY